MPAEPANTCASVSKLGTACRAAASATAVVSALFCLAVSALLLVNQARLVQRDPLNATVLKDLRLRFVEAPQDDALKQAIRLEDHRARQSYFAYRQRAGTGVWLLLGGALTLIGSLAAWSLLRDDKPDIAMLGPERAEWDRRQAAWRSLAVGAILLLAAVARNRRVRYSRSARVVTDPETDPDADDGQEPQPLNPEPPIPMQDQPDIREIDAIVGAIGRAPGDLIPILQAIQHRYHYLPDTALQRIPEITEIQPAAVRGVSTFYNSFRLQPAGRHRVCVCHGTACHVKGSEQVQEAVERHLKIEKGRDTDASGAYTVERVACVGCCTLAPVVVIGSSTYGRLTAAGTAAAFRDFEAIDSAAGVDDGTASSLDWLPGAPEIRIGVGSCCIAGGSLKLREAVVAALRDRSIQANIRAVGCVGMCHQTPLVEVVWPGADGDTRSSPSALAGAAPAGTGATAAIFARAQPGDAERIVRQAFPPHGLLGRTRAAVRGVLDRLIEGSGGVGDTYRLDVRDSPVCSFLGKQMRIATESCGHLDPLDIDAYARHGGFEALHAALGKLGPGETLDRIQASGLRGRGGAGFSTAVKWAATRVATGDPKYIICNGDEGDPGAFMNRMILESYPYRVLEGMAIAAWCIGAREGVIYVRAEYPLAVKRVREAVARMEARGLLGEAMCGGRWSLRVRVQEGAGAFVCGEETALIASIEGRRGMPRLRPPYPAVQGLWGKPTSVNNVETLSLVPWIVRHGPEAFARLGTAHSKGTKVFALTGKVIRGGLVEVPMGITLREIVEEIGGGVAPGRTLKAIQIGGPSGGCLPASLCHLPVDYEALSGAGAIMGSGGMVVMDDRDCMVDVARYFLRFTQDQSCGQCTFCRVGTRRMLDILNRLCAGQGRPDDLEKLESLAAKVKRGSLCGLGQTAPNPVLTTLRYFREEYEAHIQGRCPAGKCAALIRYVVTDACIGCTICAQRCPVNAIAPAPYRKHEIDTHVCTRCDVCRTACPAEAIEIREGACTR